MTTKIKAGAAKGTNNRSTKPSSSGSSSKNKKKPGTPATQHKPKPASATNNKKKLPPHKRYTEAQLKVPELNGIRPAGVKKLPNKKKGKVFVDDGDGMRTIMAMVMAEKEGNIESKMQKARHMEELREARRVEMEKKAQSKKEGMEERKNDIKKGKKKGRKVEREHVDVVEKPERRPKKRVSFG